MQLTHHPTETILYVDYFSKYMFGDYECFAVKAGKIYKSQILTTKKIIIEYLNEGLELETNTSTTKFSLTCTVTDTNLNQSRIQWERDDMVILILYPDGNQLTLPTIDGYTGK